MDYRYIPFYVQGNAITGIYYGQWSEPSDRDIEYVKEMYPQAFSKIQDFIERECDRQEFAGSMMFDEYPDKLGVIRMVGNIFDKVKESNLVLLAQLYYAYVLRKKECSYDLSSFSENIQCFYSKTEIWKMIIKIAIGKLKFWK